MHVPRYVYQFNSYNEQVTRAAPPKEARKPPIHVGANRVIRRIVRTVVAQENEHDSCLVLKYLLERRVPLCFRCLRMAFVLVCFVLCSQQAYERLTHYLEWPVVVDVRTELKGELEFPAVTVCTAALDSTEALMRSANFSLTDSLEDQGECLSLIPQMLKRLEPSVTVMSLWKAMNVTPALNSVEVTMDTNPREKISLKNRMLAYGCCTTIAKRGRQPFLGVRRTLKVIMKAPLFCGQLIYYTIVLHNSDETPSTFNYRVIQPGIQTDVEVINRHVRLPLTIAIHSTFGLQQVMLKH